MIVPVEKSSTSAPAMRPTLAETAQTEDRDGTPVLASSEITLDRTMDKANDERPMTNDCSCPVTSHSAILIGCC